MRKPGGSRVRPAGKLARPRRCCARCPAWRLPARPSDPEEPQHAVPVELRGNGHCREATRDDLQDHAPAAGIQICEDGGHLWSVLRTSRGTAKVAQASRAKACEWPVKRVLIRTGTALQLPYAPAHEVDHPDPLFQRGADPSLHAGRPPARNRGHRAGRMARDRRRLDRPHGGGRARARRRPRRAPHEQPGPGRGVPGGPRRVAEARRRHHRQHRRRQPVLRRRHPEARRRRSSPATPTW